MEFEDVSEKIEWEARRVAVAFGVEELIEKTYPSSDVYADFEGYVKETLVEWSIERATLRLDGITVGINVVGLVQIICSGPNEWRYEEGWLDESNPAFNQFMARGLYCLGIEDENVLAELNHPLTAHEKLELRLSMPRESWPQKWIDEAKDE